MYTIGDDVPIKAVANDGWKFVHWKDKDDLIVSSEETYVILGLDADTTYTAVFAQKTVNVTAEVNPDDEEGGTVSGGDTYAVGESVTLTATTNTDWRFKDWTDEEGVEVSDENIYEFTAPDEDVTYTANFVEQVEIEAEADPTNGGSVFGAGTYDANSLVTLKATPYPGWRFNGWFWDGGFTNIPIFVTIASPSLEDLITYTAEFVQTVTVTGLANPTNAGSVSGGGVYDIGATNITLTATALNNWVFVNWSDGTTNNPYTIPPVTNPNITGITYTANFEAAPIITVSADTNTLTLAWPAGFLGWILQAQTNDLSSTNWFDLPGTGATNSAVFSVDPVNPAVFYRLRQP